MLIFADVEKKIPNITLLAIYDTQQYVNNDNSSISHDASI